MGLLPSPDYHSDRHGQRGMIRLSNRWLWLAIIIAASAACLLLIYSTHTREPSANGKTLGEWFKIAQSGFSDNSPATKAIVSMGPAAVPFLAKKLHYEEGAWLRTYRIIWQKMPVVTRRITALRPLPVDVIPNTAVRLLYEMGDDSRLAGTDIMAVYERRFILRYKLPPSTKIDWTEQVTNPPALMTAGRMSFGPLSEVSFYGMKCLTMFCTNTEIVALMLATAHENKLTFNRGCPVWFNADDATNLLTAIEKSEPLLLASANGQDNEVRYLAIQLLSTILPTHPELRPLFIKATESPESSERLAALGALGKIHLDFDTALPMFGRLITDTNSAVSNAAFTLVFPSLGHGVKFFPILSNSLSSTNASMQIGAAQIMRLFPARAKQAAPKLAELADPMLETNEQVRAAAAETLKAIAAQ